MTTATRTSRSYCYCVAKTNHSLLNELLLAFQELKSTIIHFLGNFLNWDSLHARLNSSKVYSIQEMYSLLRIYSEKLFWSQVKGKHSIGREFQSLCQKRNCWHRHLLTSRNGDGKIMQSIRTTSRPPSRIRKWNQFSQFRWTSTKIIVKTYAGYISTMSQGFKRGIKWRTNSSTYPFCS